ncbi:eukaryotic translation initiation factor 4E type 2-like isoform X1 [Varroa jacobsoni]|uniref:eukaryotic translation initiation factor 4E type 2-like isoform X1 n=1 Tax=Varroa jacobsoni TaxID=62625 RepID=UPI000BF26091|nr:eukaryotic translation initiation factor 4E type 2-like isoform X1 [Varroa jacobsoni]XP_022697928.1 eukaryotic translation initiation factor 4E type 2-like isoform X1 [Varroa jacobsoni]
MDKVLGSRPLDQMRLHDGRRLEESGSHSLLGGPSVVGAWQQSHGQSPSSNENNITGGNGGGHNQPLGGTIRSTSHTQQQPSSQLGGRDLDVPRLDLVDEQIRQVDSSCLDVGPEEHPLEHGYSMWFSRRTGFKQAGTMPKFEDSLKLLATFRSVEKFWKCYTHLRFPNELTGHADYHLFKYGVKPMWEDPANRDGGKWIVRLRKGVASRVWENVLLAILGEQFLVGDEICGAVMSVRYNQEDIISVWNRTASDKGVRLKIMETLRRVANLPMTHTLEYKAHNTSLLDNSSFRNTDETFFR